jgi:hypothetical protein
VLYLGNPSKGPVEEAMRDGRIGMIATPAQGNPVIPGATWCADSGVFGKGYPGDDAYLAWLDERREYADRCLFATAPDVVGDAAATQERSRPLLSRIRALGYPVAFVAQNGCRPGDLPWDEFDVLFIGGSPRCRPCGYVRPIEQTKQKTCPLCHRWLTEWKLGLTARSLCLEAKCRGKHVHVGRVNSAKRWRLFEALDVDSCDGTYFTFGPAKNLARQATWALPQIQGAMW